MEIIILDVQHLPKDALAVTIMAANTRVAIEPIKRVARLAAGIWRVEDLTLAVAGVWTVEVAVRLSRFEMAKPSGVILVPWFPRVREG